MAKGEPKEEMRHKVSEDLSSLLVPIQSISPWPGNPRQGDVGAIVTSLRRFGQLKPVVVQRSSNHIAAGNHVWKAAKELGWTHIAANRVDLSDWEARAYLLADNRMSDLGTYDETIMAEMLKEIAAAGDLEGTGFDGEDVDDLLAKIDQEPGIKPQLAISGELMEEHNYVVLYFDNALDWNVAVEKLRIETKKTPDSTDTYHRAGIGRVIRGIDVIERLKDA